MVKHYVNLGIAAATERGLIVPNVKDAHALSLPGPGPGAGRPRRDRAGRQVPARPTWPAARSRSPTSASSASTPAPRSSPRASRRSSRSARSGTCPGWYDGRARGRARSRTLALSFDHRIVDGELGSPSCATSAPCWRTPSACSPGADMPDDALLSWSPARRRRACLGPAHRTTLALLEPPRETESPSPPEGAGSRRLRTRAFSRVFPRRRFLPCGAPCRVRRAPCRPAARRSSCGTSICRSLSPFIYWRGVAIPVMKAEKPFRGARDGRFAVRGGRPFPERLESSLGFT